MPPDAGCEADTLTVLLDDVDGLAPPVPVQTLCASTNGWQILDLHLGPGDLALTERALRLVLLADATGATVIDIRLETVIATGTYLCDDGDPATGGDHCVLGMCR